MNRCLISMTLKEGLAGSHEFQTGFFGAPRSAYDTTTLYLNDGFILEERRQLDAADPPKGTILFHRRYATPTELTSSMARDRNFAVYIFNILSAGDYTQYNYDGANEQFNPNYLGMRNQQPARALQVTTVYRF